MTPLATPYDTGLVVLAETLAFDLFGGGAPGSGRRRRFARAGRAAILTHAVARGRGPLVAAAWLGDALTRAGGLTPLALERRLALPGHPTVRDIYNRRLPLADERHTAETHRRVSATVDLVIALTAPWTRGYGTAPPAPECEFVERLAWTAALSPDAQTVHLAGLCSDYLSLVLDDKRGVEALDACRYRDALLVLTGADPALRRMAHHTFHPRERPL